MKSNQGENLASEWANDPHSPELWDSLELMSVDPGAGLARLEQLAELGSPLAMMHLGHIFFSGQFGVGIDVTAGEDWLRRSAAGGSIEGGYRLAKALQSDGREEEAATIYRGLSMRGYSPAEFSLGMQQYFGKRGPRNVGKALEHFSLASARGHLHAKHWKSHILMKYFRGLIPWLRGFWDRMGLFVPLLYYWINFPNSDRLRR